MTTLPLSNDDSNPSLNEICYEYRQLILADVTDRTAYVYENAWKKRVTNTLGPMPVQGITGLQIKLAWASWHGSDSSKTDTLAVISKSLGIAVDAGLIPSNPARNLKIKRCQKSSPAARALTPVELKRFLDFTPAGPYRRIIGALTYTGCRLGEIAGFTLADVDFDRELINISRSLSPNPSGKLVLGDTKSHRSRVVPILSQLQPILNEAKHGKDFSLFAVPWPTWWCFRVRQFESKHQVERVARQGQKESTWRGPITHS